MSLAAYTNLVKRLSIPDAVTSFQIPNNISWVLLRNAGANNLKFNFDNSATHYFTIEAGKTLPGAIQIPGGSTIYADGIGGDTILEVVAWG